MYRGLRVAVVVPAFNEERSVAGVLTGLPAWVDRVVVVDDASTDATSERARAASRRGLVLLRHAGNRGVGAAIATGYQEAMCAGMDAAVVMAGDGQMDPADLPALLDPLVERRADYVKGNRFLHPDVLRVMPWTRVAGNVLLSLLTRLATGCAHVFDSQCGYAAASRAALLAIDPERMFPRYGYPNDVLARLHRAGMRVADVSVRPVYGTGWRSGIRLRMLIYPFAFVLLRAFLRRMLSAAGLGRLTSTGSKLIADR